MVQKYHSYMRILIKASNIDIKCIYINDTRGCHSILLKRKELLRFSFAFESQAYPPKRCKL